ncbi:hypothetical protein EHQ59_03110 [Leptospira kemamanensis]|uniref:Galactose oxidase n=1 Tax=Leptospira kemamanensis TaxID=2484942 RepID=A0A4R9JU70_9LEPT|nr:hypothetical protein [Leptospira kemamanensis]TGL55790.1 hypothetical protein EHQ59_03110 [Leptospira kemamanensis]
MKRILRCFFATTLLIFLSIAFTQCKPADLENSCDVKSDSFLLASVVRFVTGDKSPSCLPAFPIFEDYGVYGGASTTQVRSILAYRNHLLIGGDFTKVGLATGSVAILDKQTGKAVPNRFCPFLKVNGETYSAVSDGAGGFYIGGIFTHVQGFKRSQVAHILPGCQLDPNFNVTEDSTRTVYTLHLLGDNLYIGGNFASWGSNPQSNIASVNRYTGELNTGFYPGAMNNYVYSIVSFGNSLFIGGSFDTIGALRIGIAKLNATTGVVDTSFTAQLNPGGVAIDLNIGSDPQGSPVVYVVGSFSTPRNNAAAFYPDGTLTPWNPNPSDPVQAVQQYENTVYLGGSFTNVSGAPIANHLVGVDNDTGSAVKNDFDIDQPVTTLQLIGNQLYALGLFTTAKGFSRNFAASFDLPSGNLTDWNPSLLETVSNPGGAVIAYGNDVALAFNKYGVNLQPKKNFLVLDEASGAPIDGTPEFDYGIQAMHLKGDKLIVGGSFENVNGNPRRSLALLDLPHYQLNATNFGIVGLSAEVRTITSGNGQIFFGGAGLDSIQSQTRNGVASVTDDNFTITNWYPNLDTGGATSLLFLDNAVYIAGIYSTLNSDNTVLNYRAVDSIAGTAISLPSISNYPNFEVKTQTLYEGKIYLGGIFTSISGIGTFNHIAIYDLATKSYINPNPVYANGFVQAFTPSPDGRILVAGSFTGLNGSTNSSNLAAFQANTYEVLNWAPNPDNSAYTSLYHNGRWYVGGEFIHAFNKPNGGIFSTDLSEPPNR